MLWQWNDRFTSMIGSATDAMRPQLAVVTCRFFSRVRTRANLYLALHVAGRGYPCLDSASAVEQPPTTIPRTTTYKARSSTKLTNNYHVRPRPTDFITFWSWLSQGFKRNLSFRFGTKHLSTHLSKHDVDPMLVQCWPTVRDAGQAFNQHWFNASCLLGCVQTSKHKTFL